MKRRIAVFLALIIFATGLGIGIHSWTQRGVIILGDPSWPSLTLGTLSRIDLKSPEGDFSFAPQKDIWYVYPENGRQRVRVVAEKLQALLDTIGQKPPLDRVARFTRREKEQYGLDNSTIGITLHGSDIWGIALGADGTSDDTIFARSSLQGDQVHLIDKKYRELLTRSAASFYDLKLVSASTPEAITKISAEGPGAGVWELSRKNENFVFTAPEQQSSHALAQAKVELYLHTLVNARARTVAAMPEKKLPPAQLKLAVWTKKSDTPDTIEIYHDGNNGKTFLAKLSRQEAPVVLDAELVEKLTASAFALREKPVLEVDLSQAEEQHFILYSKGNSREYSAVRADDGWQDASTGKELTGLDMIMWRMGSLQFVDNPKTSVPQGIRQVLSWQFRGHFAEELATVFFYTDPASSGRCWVQVQGEDIWFPVDRLLLNDLMSRLPAQ